METRSYVVSSTFTIITSLTNLGFGTAPFRILNSLREMTRDIEATMHKNRDVRHALLIHHSTQLRVEKSFGRVSCLPTDGFFPEQILVLVQLYAGMSREAIIWFLFYLPRP